MGRRALRKLLALSHAYEAEHPAAPARDLVTHLRQVLDAEVREKAPEMSPDADAVRVLTAHASKGLEFPVVIAADSRQKVRSKRDKKPFHEPGAGLVFPAENESSAEFTDRARRGWNEARCLWYVTLTRAKQRLIITATNDQELEENKYPQPNTFFEELWNLEADAPTPGVQLGGPPPALDEAPPAVSARAEGDEGSVLKLKARLKARLKRAKPELGFSPSAFHRYQLCPAAYRYDYVARLGGLPDPADLDDVADAEAQAEGGAPETRGGAQMGTVFHAAAGAHARLEGATAESLLGAVDAAELATLTPEQRETVRAWLERYLESNLGRERPRPESVERELTLAMEFEPARLVMRGKADRLEPRRLVDFKTDAKVEGLTQRYGDQLRLYALAARRAGWLGPAAEIAIYHAPTGSYLSVPFTEEDEAQLTESLADFAQNLAQPEPAFPPVRSELCRWCAARETVCERTRKHAHTS